MTTISGGRVFPHRIQSLEWTDKIVKLTLVDGGQVIWPNRGASSLHEGTLHPLVVIDGKNIEAADYGNGQTFSNAAQTDAIAALVQLGQSKADATRHVNEAMTGLPCTATTEQILAAALGQNKRKV